MDKSHQHVIVLHGLGRTRRSMWWMAKSLGKAGFIAHNIDYPSTRHNIETLTNQYLAPVIHNLGSTRRIHIVTHSLGGILARQYLQNNRLPEGSRIVMLAPPNHGSEVADRLKDWWLFKKLDGPAGQQLGTDAASTPNSLKPISNEVGIITGENGFLLPTSNWIPGPNDGLVSVESAKLKEMSDFLVLDCGHTFIMNHPQVIQQTRCFLEHGKFQR